MLEAAADRENTSAVAVRAELEGAMDLVTDVTKTAIELFPRTSVETLRTTIADNLSKVLVERQIRELRQSAIEAVRAALLPLVDSAIAEALAAAEHEDDAAWAQWKKVLGDAPVKN
jgi:hypothetical protein